MLQIAFWGTESQLHLAFLSLLWCVGRLRIVSSRACFPFGQLKPQFSTIPWSDMAFVANARAFSLMEELCSDLSLVYYPDETGFLDYVGAQWHHLLWTLQLHLFIFGISLKLTLKSHYCLEIFLKNVCGLKFAFLSWTSGKLQRVS